MPVTRKKSLNINYELLAPDINYLVYAYLIDAGFEHAAYNLRSEARLDTTSDKKSHIQRHLLVQLLAKALLYVEVESHYREDGKTVQCTAPFSLLKKHVCSTSPRRTVDLVPMSVNPTPTPDASDSTRDPLKRKGPGRGGSVGGKRGRPSKVQVVGDEDADMEDAQSVPQTPLVPPRETNLIPHELTNGRAAKRFKESNLRPAELIGTHENEVYICAWNPSFPALLATGSRDASVCIWDAGTSQESGKPYETLTDPLANADITCLDWNPEGSLLATGSMDMYLRVWEKSGNMHIHSNLETGGSIPAHNQGPIYSVRFSPSGRLLAACLLDGTVTVWDVKEKRPKIHLKSHRTTCLDVDWRDEFMVATCGSDGQIVLSSLDPSASNLGWRGHQAEINQLRFNGARDMLASCSDDHTTKIWEIPPLLASSTVQELESDTTRLLVCTLNGHQGRVTRVMWSTLDMETVATCSFDSTARLWNAKTGECLRTIEGHTRSCFTACFSPDGYFFASAGGDGSVFVTSVKTGERVAEWKDEDSNVVFDIRCRLVDGKLSLAICVGRQVRLMRVT
ncbi:WD40 repeat-like protein [Exidia glandulosa HHB12029]|uniref:WD40 repeat-like protein n=1 Tax=Exidia glandulosa HHB12029 TaxID=1314781 RepID=A0A165MBE9_EXIGL|nr:WD40 repeat-like protein [Exidia glandulosa HHB12029]